MYASNTPVLQSRMFAYPDAARYRVGANYQQLPCNRPVCEVYQPYERNGAMRYETNYGSDPSYVQSQLKPIRFKGKIGANGYSVGHWKKEFSGIVAGYESEVTEDDFIQAKMMWDVLCKSNEQEDFVGNVVETLGDALPELQKPAIGTLYIWPSSLASSPSTTSADSQKCSPGSTRTSVR